MRVVIIGAGNAGRNLAAKLCAESHDVVVVDHSSAAIEEIQSKLDIQCIEGEGASPAVLAEARVDKADLMVAVTDRDEVNLFSCVLAHAAGVPHTVARASNPDYLKSGPSFHPAALGIDLVINQQEECARELFNVLRMSGTLEAVDMLEGRVLAVGIKAHVDSPLILHSLKTLPKEARVDRIRFIAAMRGDEVTIPHGDTQFMIGDDIYLVGEVAAVREFIEWACPEHSRYGRVVIAGGGDLGLSLAHLLESIAMEVVLIERDAGRAEECSRQLDKAMVLRGDALDQATLENAGVVSGSAFVAVTGSDENNIMICLLAEQAGATFTVAQVARPEYVPVIDQLSLLDRAVSSHMSMINAILHFVRGKNVKEAALLHKLPGELLEVVLPPGNRRIGRPIRDLRMPDGILIATALRQDTILPATGELMLQSGDRLILFALPEAVNRIESLIRT